MTDGRNIFVSYVRGDEASERVVADLAAGLPVWRDTKDIGPGESWPDALEEALENATAFVVLVTPQASQSSWLAYEVGYAMARSAESPEVRVVPVLLGGATRSDLLAALPSFRWIDADELGPEEIVDSVRREVATGAASA